MAHQARPTVFGKRKEPHTVIIARGDTIRHFTVRPWAAALLGSACAAMAVGYLLATSYLVLRDDLIGASIARQARMQQAYEDRISALRAQVDRLTSRQLLDQQLVESKVSELLKRQAQLSQRHGRLTPLLDRAANAMEGEAPPVPTPRPDERAAAEALPANGAALRPGRSAGKPQLAAAWGAPLAFAPSESPADRADKLFVAINSSLRSIEDEQLKRLETLSHKARSTSDAVTQALQAAGLPVADDYGKEDTGGPMVAIRNPSRFDTKVKDLDDALDRLDALKAELEKVPIANPAPGRPVTSGFGYRRDPLLGMAAMHTGIDFRSRPYTAVTATAAGTVTRAGWAGGYGRMVEIDHGGGYATRYGHLNEVLVDVGQKVGLGDLIGRSGNTGRSTGPHLHYEVRHNGAAVDPVIFLRAGRVIRDLL